MLQIMVLALVCMYLIKLGEEKTGQVWVYQTHVTAVSR